MENCPDPFFTYNQVVAGSPNAPGSGYNSVLAFTGSSKLVYNPYAHSPSTFDLSGPGTFDLNSFVIAGAWDNQTLTIEGLLSSTAIFSSALPVTSTAQLVTLNWSGIDALRITIDSSGYTDTVSGGSGQHWALDNIVVNQPIAQPVPEPAAMALFGIGLVGLGFGRRRKTA